MSRRRGGSNLGVLMLGAQILNMGVDTIPPVTMALVIGQSAIFLDAFHKYFPSAYGVCMSSYLVTQHKDWYRMILGSLYHADDMHLYFNMISLLYKGRLLEPMFGSPYFAYLVSVFTVLTSATYVGMGVVLGQTVDPSYYTSCAIGFSGVIFALKVLATEYSPQGTQYAFGIIPVPSKYIFWVELGLIQLITPNASFVGHLAGILVGLAYTKGPLKPLMDSFFPPDPSRRYTRAHQSGHRRSFWGSSFPSFGRFFGGGHPTGTRRQGYAQPSAPPPENMSDYNGGPPSDYHRYTGGLDEDEQMRRAMQESTWQQSDPSQNPSFQRRFDDEDEQFQRAMEESMKQQQNPGQSSSSQRLYPNLDDLRSRRARFYQ